MSKSPIVNIIDSIDACVNYKDTHGNNWGGSKLSDEKMYNFINKLLEEMGINGVQPSGFTTVLRNSNRGEK